MSLGCPPEHEELCCISVISQEIHNVPLDFLLFELVSVLLVAIQCIGQYFRQIPMIVLEEVHKKYGFCYLRHALAKKLLFIE